MGVRYNLPVEYNRLKAKERKEVREQYIKEQGELCWFCHEKLSAEPPKTILEHKINLALFPPNFLKNPVHLQHDHSSGLTEGAVHAYCNAVLWQYHGR